MDRESTSGLRPQQLARLLAVGARGPQPPPGDPAGALDELLARGICLDPADPESLPAVLGRPCDELRAMEGRGLGAILLDAQADPAAIRTLKDYAKELTRRLGAGPRHAAATAVYYGAIAQALALRGETITQHSRGQLRLAFAKLEAKPWIPPGLKDLFVQARQCCQEGKP